MAKHFEFIPNAFVDAPQIDTVNLFPRIEVDITFRSVLLPTSFLQLPQRNPAFLLTVAEKPPLVC